MITVLRVDNDVGTFKPQIFGLRIRHSVGAARVLRTDRQKT